MSEDVPNTNQDRLLACQRIRDELKNLRGNESPITRIERCGSGNLLIVRGNTAGLLALAELIVDAASCKSHAPGEPTFTHHGHQLQQSSEGKQAAYILGLMKHDDLEFKEYLATPPNKLKDQLACLGCATVLILFTIFVVIPLFIFYGSLFDGKFL